jgi:MFS-type transporter involved in bile tolerance (Atg22 family)
MNFLATFSATLQVIAAFLIFVAVYLSLLVFTITCLVAAELISEGASLVRNCMLRRASLNSRVWSENGGGARRSMHQYVSKDAVRLPSLALVRGQRH